MRVLTVVNTANPSAYDASMLLAAFFSSQGIENDVVLSVDLPTPEEHTSELQSPLQSRMPSSA